MPSWFDRLMTGGAWVLAVVFMASCGGSDEPAGQATASSTVVPTYETTTAPPAEAVGGQVDTNLELETISQEPEPRPAVRQ